jgi:hypothetical protein
MMGHRIYMWSGCKPMGYIQCTRYSLQTDHLTAVVQVSKFSSRPINRATKLWHCVRHHCIPYTKTLLFWFKGSILSPSGIDTMSYTFHASSLPLLRQWYLSPYWHMYSTAILTADALTSQGDKHSTWNKSEPSIKRVIKWRRMRWLG